MWELAAEWRELKFLKLKVLVGAGGYVKGAGVLEAWSLCGSWWLSEGSWSAWGLKFLWELAAEWRELECLRLKVHEGGAGCVKGAEVLEAHVHMGGSSWAMEMLSLRLKVYVGADGSVKGAGSYVAESLWWSWRLCAGSWRLCEQTKNRV